MLPNTVIIPEHRKVASLRELLQRGPEHGPSDLESNV